MTLPNVTLWGAREHVVDRVLAGDVRNVSAPIQAIRDPEPSAHPDERMNLTLKDIRTRQTALDREQRAQRLKREQR